MKERDRAEFDLAILAGNGLRRGRTTGSCATAAVKAALYMLLANDQRERVDVSLPDGQHYLVVPIQELCWLDADRVRAGVLKDGGDDPDNTHGATIYAEVRRNTRGELCFIAGQGVGIATQPGLRVEVGQPAINPVPRQMMRQAVAEVLAELDEGKYEVESALAMPSGLYVRDMPKHSGINDENLLSNVDLNHNYKTQIESGFDLVIGCVQGEEIAKKTFNPRLGIVGGISILGTSGIVEPMSLASWIASIEVYVRVALGGNAQRVAYLPGKIGRHYAREHLGLPDKRSVQIANFLGDALDFTQQALQEEQRSLDELWLVGHPGKLAKVLDGAWDTHSSKSNMAMVGVAKVAEERGFSPDAVRAMANANTVEAIIEQLNALQADTVQHNSGQHNLSQENLSQNNPGQESGIEVNINKTDPMRAPYTDTHVTLAQALWTDIEQRIAALAQQRVPAVKRVEVRLFDLHGKALGMDACTDVDRDTIALINKDACTDAKGDALALTNEGAYTDLTINAAVRAVP